MTSEPFRPRSLVYMDHRPPDGQIRVQLAGSPNTFTASTREEALQIARKIAGNDCRIFESLGARRRPR